jgi:predicted RNA-binding Zn-ribbon protein involved in translation (DUF1610 family)
MIVRSSFKCATCGQVHTVRIGMGQETRQTHRFPCVNCGEDMVVALNVDYQASPIGPKRSRTLSSQTRYPARRS